MIDVAIIGAGAAGLMSGISAGRSGNNRSVVVLDGARRPGAKILVAGGGRCNVTHATVNAEDYSGSSRNAIRQVLRRFPLDETIRFFAGIGVELKQEETGKLFPVTDRAETVLQALLKTLHESGAVLKPAWRVERLDRSPEGTYRLTGSGGTIDAGKVILATGGKSLPRTGSDGLGYHLARRLGHTLTPHIFPALAPLVLPEGHFIKAMPGVSAPVRVAVRTSTGKNRAAVAGSLLCTHFGLSGPAILDISRHLTEARFDDPEAQLIIDWVPQIGGDELEHMLLRNRQSTIGTVCRSLLPDRLLRALLAAAGIESGDSLGQLSRERRKRVIQTMKAYEAPVVGDRGYKYAEVTAGGVPLSEVHLKTMESRISPGLHLCGELCDVDGRIGGFNFQWAWASGYVAGSSV